MNKFRKRNDNWRVDEAPPVSLFRKKYLVVLIAAGLSTTVAAQNTPVQGWNDSGDYIVTTGDELTDGYYYFDGPSSLEVVGGKIEDFYLDSYYDPSEGSNILNVSGGRASYGSVNGDAASVIVRDGVLSHTQLIGNESTIEIADGNVNDILVYGNDSEVTVDGGSLDKIYIGGPQFRGGSNLKLSVNGGEVATVLIDNEGRGGKGESHVELNGGVLRD